jgi:uncharacterized protein
MLLLVGSLDYHTKGRICGSILEGSESPEKEAHSLGLTTARDSVSGAPRHQARPIWEWLPVLAGMVVVVVLAVARFLGLPTGVLGPFTTRFLGTFIEAAPFLVLGAVTSGLIEVFVDRSLLTRVLPRRRPLALLTGAGLGFLFPVCECGVVPVTRRLLSKGLPLSVAVTFLLASPVMNPIVLVSTWSAFGLGPMLLGRYIVTLVVTVAIGLVFALHRRPWEALRDPSIIPITGGAVDTLAESKALPQFALLPRVREALSLATDEFLDMGRYLVIGSLLAAALQTLISQDALTALGRGPITSVLTMQALAFLLSVCSTVDAFIALSFRGTFTAASILVFLTFGPMVDVKSTLMFLGVFKPRVVLYLVALPLLMTMAIGIWLNLNVRF